MKREASDRHIYNAGPWITEEDVAFVTAAMRDGWYDYTHVEAFQREFAAWHDRAYGIMTPNCTSAIHLLLAGLGIGPGDEVLLPECTWIGSSAPVTHAGATPIFCDVDDGWCIDPASAEARITPRTKAIIAVDLYGNMPRMTQLAALAQKHGLHLIEDAAESLGSVYRGVRAGKFGVGSVFSFHRTKTLTTGEGGMLLVDDPALWDRCMFLRDHGRNRQRSYEIDEVAFKYMPFNIQAAIGRAQFRRIDAIIGRKRHHLQRFRDGLADIDGLTLNTEPPDGVNGAWATSLVFDRAFGLDQDTAVERLRAHGVPARGFFRPLSSQPCYGLEESHRPLNPVAYDISDRAVTLPCALNMTEDDLDRVIAGVRKAAGH